MGDEVTGAPPRAVIIVAAILASVLAIAIAIFGLTSGFSGKSPADIGPLPLVPIPAPQAASPSCDSLIRDAPQNLVSNNETLPRRELANPAPAATLAWGTENPIVLRCGLDKPPELTQTAPLRVINGVEWLQVTSDGSSTWYVVDRLVYVALTVPDSAGTGPLQEISTTISRSLPPQPPRS